MGVCFVVFTDQQDAARALDRNFMTQQIRSKMSVQTARMLGADQWSIKVAYLQSDIIWQHLGKSRLWATLKRVILFVSLFLLSFVLLTPTYAISWAKPYIQEMFSWDKNASDFIMNYCEPILVWLINFGLVPNLIDYSTLLEDFQRKSSRQNAIMHRNFFFMFVNLFILPIMQKAVALDLFEDIKKEQLSFASKFSLGFMVQQIFFLKFIIALLFISNGFWLTDMFHRLYVCIGRRIHQHREAQSVIKTRYKDEYEFDIGYHQSYSLVIFLACLLFAILVPLISFFAFLFFFVKYFIDKYNLIFVYYKVYESGGKVRKHVMWYMVFNLFLYLGVTVSFFALKFGKTEYLYGGIVIIITWSCVYFATKRELKSAYHLDSDLKNKQGAKPSGRMLSSLAIERYKRSVLISQKIQENIALRMGHEAPNVLVYDDSILDTEEVDQAVLQNISVDGQKDFEKKVREISKFNEKQLRLAYSHPFRRVNPKLYHAD